MRNPPRPPLSDRFILNTVVALLCLATAALWIWALSVGIEKSTRIALMEQEQRFVAQAGGLGR